MRVLFYSVLIGVCLAMPALAQSGAGGSATASAPQSQPAKDSNTSAQTAKPVTDQSKSPSDPAPQTSTADPMSDYNINGNAVGDGLGVPR